MFSVCQGVAGFSTYTPGAAAVVGAAVVKRLL
jgi:hypothetical protein